MRDADVAIVQGHAANELFAHATAIPAGEVLERGVELLVESLGSWLAPQHVGQARVGE